MLSWSPEHGATGTAFSSWLLGCLVWRFDPISALTSFLLCVALVNLPWFWKQKMRRDRLLSLWIYGSLGGAGSVWLIFDHPLGLWVLTGLAFSGGIFFVLEKRGQERSIVVESVAFAALTAPALLSGGLPESMEWRVLFFFWLAAALWFGYSLPLIRYQRGKIGVWPVLIYLIVGSACLFFLNDRGTLLLFPLFALRLLSKMWSGKRRSRHELRRTGFAELGWAAVYLVLFTLLIFPQLEKGL